MNKIEFKNWLYHNCSGAGCGDKDGTCETILKVSIDEIVNAACRYQTLQCRFPWVFWLNIKIRRKWFSYFWKTRGTNFLEIQFFIFYISIGMPWKECVLESHIKDYGTLDSIKNTNIGHLKRFFTFQIGKYKNIL